MKRNPRKVKCTKAYKRLHGKDMTQRKRNRPERYNRNHIESALNAMKNIVDLRGRWEARHIEKRMKGKKAKEQKEAVKELNQSIHLVKAPGALQKNPSLILPIKVEVIQQQPEQNRMEE